MPPKRRVNRKYGVGKGEEWMVPSRKDARKIRKGNGKHTGYNMPKAKRVQKRLVRKGQPGLLDLDRSSGNYGHWSSVNPKTNKLLKQSKHETVGKELNSPYGRANASKLKTKNIFGRRRKYYRYGK